MRGDRFLCLTVGLWVLALLGAHWCLPDHRCEAALPKPYVTSVSQDSMLSRIMWEHRWRIQRRLREGHGSHRRWVQYDVWVRECRSEYHWAY